MASFDLFPPDRYLAFMTFGKGFLAALLGWTRSLLLVVGLHETGRDSPPKVKVEKVQKPNTKLSQRFETPLGRHPRDKEIKPPNGGVLLIEVINIKDYGLRILPTLTHSKIPPYLNRP